jgi:DNA replication protein DnaC
MLNVDLLIVDELGFVPFDRAGGELLFNVLAERHGQRFTVITSHRAFGEWVQVFGDEKLTTALLDRLGPRSHSLTTKGPSYRTSKKAKEESSKTAL